MICYKKINITFDDSVLFDCQLQKEDSFECKFDGVAIPNYSGSYVVTPSQQAQELPTANKILGQNIIVNPLPSYYGLITWNGSVLTVS